MSTGSPAAGDLSDVAAAVKPPTAPAAGSDFALRLRANSEYLAIPAFALLAAALLFAVFLLAIGKSPIDFIDYVWRGGFGTAFSFQNTLQRSSPLILTALAVAIPARIGLIMIGAEGALVLGGFAAAAIAVPMIGVVPPIVTMPVMVLTAVVVGGIWVGIAGYLRYARGVNETISSLLLTYIGIAIMNFFVEGVMRDASNPNKPSTKPIGDAYMVGKIPGTDVHWGFAVGVLLSIALYFLMTRTTFGFAARVTGGNFRAALAQGLPVGKLIVTCAMIAGGCAGLAGSSKWRRFRAAPTLRWRPATGSPASWCRFWRATIRWSIVPIAILFGGLVASGGLIQRRMGLPDATVLVLQGLIFVVLLTSETLYGRFAIFNPKKGTDRT